MNILISSIYYDQSIIALINKFQFDCIYLLLDHKMPEKMINSLSVIEKIFKSSNIKLIKVNTELYDIVSIAADTVKIIDQEKNHKIYIDITQGRKTKSLGMLFGAYSRIKFIEKITYVPEETKEPIALPKMSFFINEKQKEILKFINKKNIVVATEIMNELNLSKAIVYRYIGELVEYDMLCKKDQQITITDFGKIVSL